MLIVNGAKYWHLDELEDFGEVGDGMSVREVSAVGQDEAQHLVVVDGTRIDNRKAPVVQGDELGHDLGAVAVAVAQDWVNTQPAARAVAHRHPLPGAGGCGKPVTSNP